ncbi:hypothetical protein, partial [Neglectibacter timonensis]|uniref:hypothetical protein n=1 Tax=Neglectibacter timonensis TaxID=1776382 RepID=UPI00248E8ECD
TTPYHITIFYDFNHSVSLFFDRVSKYNLSPSLSAKETQAETSACAFCLTHTNQSEKILPLSR